MPGRAKGVLALSARKIPCFILSTVAPIFLQPSSPLVYHAAGCGLYFFTLRYERQPAQITGAGCACSPRRKYRP